MNNYLKTKSIKKIEISIILIIVGFLLIWGCCKVRNLYEQENAIKNGLSSTEKNIVALEDQVDKLDKLIQSSNKRLINLTTDKNKLIASTGSLSDIYNVKINKLLFSDIKQDGNMKTLTVNLEIEGDLLKIRAFINEFCNSENIYNIKTMSLRQNNKFIWLTRSIDNNKVLDWFGNYEEKEEVEGENIPKDIDEIFDRTNMKCYVEIDFIGL